MLSTIGAETRCKTTFHNFQLPTNSRFAVVPSPTLTFTLIPIPYSRIEEFVPVSMSAFISVHGDAGVCIRFRRDNWLIRTPQIRLPRSNNRFLPGVYFITVPVDVYCWAALPAVLFPAAPRVTSASLGCFLHRTLARCPLVKVSVVTWKLAWKLP